MGRLQKMLNFNSVSGKKLLFTFAKKMLSQKGKKFLGYVLVVRSTTKKIKEFFFLSFQNNGYRPYAAYIQDKAPEPFPLRNSLFWLNMKSSFIPEAELE